MDFNEKIIDIRSRSNRAKSLEIRKEVASLLGDFIPRREIIQIIGEKYGIKIRQIDYYINKSKKDLIEAFSISTQDHIIFAISRLKELQKLAYEQNKLSVVLGVQKALIDLLLPKENILQFHNQNQREEFQERQPAKLNNSPEHIEEVAKILYESGALGSCDESCKCS